jgi:hypothetical protein
MFRSILARACGRNTLRKSVSEFKPRAKVVAQRHVLVNALGVDLRGRFAPIVATPFRSGFDPYEKSTELTFALFQYVISFWGLPR